MKNIILALSLSLTIGTILTLNSCKKTETATTEDDSISAQDVATVTNAMDQTSDDAASAAGQVQSYSGTPVGLWRAFCGSVTVDTGGGKIVITYDGSSHCLGVIRSGSVTITLTNGPWMDMNAVLTIAYNNLKIVDIVSGASYTLNGTHTVTNETGGLAWKVAYGITTNTSVTHLNQASMSLTFANGSMRTWTVDRSRTWSSVVTGGQNMIIVTVSAPAADGVDVTGTNRFGNTFVNSILTPIAADNNVNCPYKPYQGKTQHAIGSRTTTVLYGTDAEGISIGTPTVCGLGYFITYVNASNGRTETRFVGYWM